MMAVQVTQTDTRTGMKRRPFTSRFSLEISIFIQPSFRAEFLSVFTPNLCASSLSIWAPGNISSCLDMCSIRPNVILKCIFLVTRNRGIQTECFKEPKKRNMRQPSYAHGIRCRQDLHCMKIRHFTNDLVKSRRIIF